MNPAGRLRRSFRDSSIRRKLMIMILAASGAVLLSAALVLAAQQAVAIRSEAKRSLAIQAEVIAANVTSAIVFHDPRSATETLAGLRANPHVLSAHIVTSDGAIFARYVAPGALPPRIEVPGSEPPALDGRAYEAVLAERTSTWDWDLDLEVTGKIVLDQEQLGAILIVSDTREVSGRILALLATLGLLSIAGLALAYGLSSRLQALISRPIQQLAGAITTVSTSRDYAVRVEVTSADELGALGAGFNAMLGAIQARDEELHEINEEIKNFAYIVSHDLRAPLVSIKGFSAELQAAIKELRPLLEKCAPSLDEKDRRRLDVIVREDVGEALGFISSSSNRMDALINNILNLSRLGRRELHLVPVDMNLLTGAILASMAHQLEGKRVEVSVAELPEVIGDRVSLEQIMGNLIDNAVKYLEPGRPGVLEIFAERSADAATFHVRDNGRGIAPMDMDKVFELFRRAGKQDVPGDGMGLAYVKTLLRRHGGRIWCESVPGVGSTFSFTLPGRPGTDGPAEP